MPKKLENLGSIPTQPPLYGTIGQKSVLLPTSNEFKIFLIITISIVGSRQPDGSGHMTLLCCRFLTAGRLLTSQCRFSLPIRRCFSINACLCAGLPSMPFKGLWQEVIMQTKFCWVCCYVPKISSYSTIHCSRVEF